MSGTTAKDKTSKYSSDDHPTFSLSCRTLRGVFWRELLGAEGTQGGERVCLPTQASEGAPREMGLSARGRDWLGSRNPGCSLEAAAVTGERGHEENRQA